MSSKPISPATRIRVRDLLAQKVAVSSIAQSCRCSIRSVYRIKKGQILNVKGRKKAYNDKNLTLQVHRAVKTITKDKQRVSAGKVLPYLSENISLRTLQKCMKQDKRLVYKNVPKILCLTSQQKDGRINAIRQWMKERINFGKVIFSDEVRFSVDGPDHFMSWQLPHYAEQYTRMKRPFNGGGIMLHGCLMLDNTLVINRIDGTMNGEKYCRLLRENALPIIRAKYGENFIWQEDNAKPHKSKVASNFFKGENIQPLSWPAHSPDLSLIESAWKLLKDIVYDSKIMSNKDELWQSIQNGIKIFNNSKSGIMSQMREKLMDRYLDVLINHGNVVGKL